MRTKLLVALLHRVLQKEGAIGAAAAGGDYEQAQLRLAASKALLKSSRISDVKIKPSPAEAWRAIALTMQVTGCHRHHHHPTTTTTSPPPPHLLHSLPHASPPPLPPPCRTRTRRCARGCSTSSTAT